MIEAKKRIAAKIEIDQETGCWNWNGCVQKNGYARITYKRKTMGAHRLSYMAFIGDIPPKLDVCHNCDNRKCVNPMHLFTGTRLENMADAVEKNRQAKSFKLPHTKLSEEQISDIVDLARQGKKYKDIADAFGICKQRAGNIAISHGVRRYGIS